MSCRSQEKRRRTGVHSVQTLEGQTKSHMVLLSPIIASSTVTVVKQAFVREELYPEELYHSTVSIVLQPVSNHSPHTASVKYWIHTSHV